MIDQLTRQDFMDLAPGSLVLEYRGRPIPMTVVEMHDLAPGSPRLSPFSMLLQGPVEPLLSQSIYPLLHPRLGRLELFIVPTSRDALHARYEVIFN